MAVLFQKARARAGKPRVSWHCRCVLPPCARVSDFRSLGQLL